MWYVYVLMGRNDRKFYIGFTDNLRRRYSEHLRGKVRSTHERGKLILLFYEAFVSKLDAQRRERYLKTSKGRYTLRLMLREALKT